MEDWNTNIDKAPVYVSLRLILKETGEEVIGHRTFHSLWNIQGYGYQNEDIKCWRPL